MIEMVLKSVKESVRAKEGFFTKKNAGLMVECAETIAKTFKNGSKLMLIGNGGSAADCQHMAAEFINRFEIERPPLPAVAFTTDSSVITSIANDYSFDLIFSKQLKALGRAGDVLLAISTSGKSKNVLKAIDAAKKLDIKTIALTGKDGGELAKKADITLNVNADSTPRIQETHITVCHIICQLVDHILFEKG